MSRKNTFPSFLEEGFFLTSSPSVRRLSSVPERGSDSGSMGCVVPCGLFAPASSVLAKGQPWFYLRLANKRGTIALLGCPREHTVPRETLRLNPAVDTYPRTRALSDRRTEQPIPTMVPRSEDSARSSCL